MRLCGVLVPVSTCISALRLCVFAVLLLLLLVTLTCVLLLPLWHGKPEEREAARLAQDMGGLDVVGAAKKKAMTRVTRQIYRGCT